MSQTIKSLPGVAFALLVAAYLVLSAQGYLASAVEMKEVVGWQFTSIGVSPVTDNSESHLGNSVGKLMDSGNGPDTLSKVCDHTSNGVDDKQAIFAENQFGAIYTVDNHRDTNGTGDGCGFHFYEKHKAAHKVYSISGGNTSRH